jgi:hypothetical protein
MNLFKKAIPMNYNNYEQKIIERYGVALKGWPVGRYSQPQQHQHPTMTLTDFMLPWKTVVVSG